MKDKRIYNIASYQRPKQLINCIQSIFNQADIINIALNNYNEIPIELYDKKINIHICDNSKGDAFKFLSLCNSNGYFFTIDDDLIYPANYSEFMIDNVNKYKKKCVVTIHGRSFSTLPIISYYRGANERYYCLREQKDDKQIQFGGTGVMCFHTNLMKIPMSYFEYSNMADIWIGKYTAEHKIPIICVKHDSYFIIQQQVEKEIFTSFPRNHNIQENIVNSILCPGYNIKNINPNEQPKTNGKEIIFNKIESKPIPEWPWNLVKK
jgi:hypothetical protein